MTKRKKPSRSEERVLLMRAIVDEVRIHGRALARDPDALLVRIIAKTGLSRARVQEFAPECLALCRIALEILRERESG